MHAAVTTITDNQRQLDDYSNGEVMTNVAMQKGPRFNCGGSYLSRECARRPNRCFKCGGQGQLAEYCDQMNSFKNNNNPTQRPRQDYPTSQQSTRTQCYQKPLQRIQNQRESRPFSKQKYKYNHQRNKRHRKFLARLASTLPDLDLVYLADLLGKNDKWIKYWEDGLCCLSDAEVDDEPFSQHDLSESVVFTEISYIRRKQMLTVSDLVRFWDLVIRK